VNQSLNNPETDDIEEIKLDREEDSHPYSYSISSTK